MFAVQIKIHKLTLSNATDLLIKNLIKSKNVFLQICQIYLIFCVILMTTQKVKKCNKQKRNVLTKKKWQINELF